MIQYSGNIWGNPHPDDLSRCENYSDFLEKLNHCIRKFFLALRKGGRLAILVGDMRLHGKFYSMQHDLMRMGDFESFLVKGQFNCVSDNRTYKKPFIPIVTEYALLLKKRILSLSPSASGKKVCFLYKYRYSCTDLASSNPDDNGEYWRKRGFKRPVRFIKRTPKSEKESALSGTYPCHLI